MVIEKVVNVGDEMSQMIIELFDLIKVVSEVLSVVVNFMIVMKDIVDEYGEVNCGISVNVMQLYENI